MNAKPYTPYLQLNVYNYLQIDLCDKRLLSIKVPDFISRPPKSLSKASQWKGLSTSISLHAFMLMLAKKMLRICTLQVSSCRI